MGPGEGRGPLKATTRVAAVIGAPVRHSLSPAIHNAAFAATGLDWTFVAFEVVPESLGAAIEGVRALGIAGISVTMPHKETVVGLVDELSPAARDLGALNCIVAIDGRLIGHNTDGDGLVAALDAEGIDVEGRQVVVLGAGGAARSVIRSIAERGAERVVVVNRSAERAARAAMLAGDVGAVGGFEALSDADVVVNATPVGMGDDTSTPFDPALIRTGQTVVDLVYHPLRTTLLAEAAARGARGIDGLGMLVGQAALSFELWTGQPAPVDAMRVGALDALRQGI